MSEPLQLEIWSDVVCPWCYIGKRRVEQAVADLDGEVETEITYRAFQLAPETPVDADGSVTDYLVEHRGVTHPQAEAMMQQVTEVASSVGLEYDMGSARQANTLRAHEVLHLARTAGRQLDLAERMFRAHFVEGRHLGSVAELAELAADIGMDRDEVTAALEAGTFADAVTQDIEQARAYGITGVPFLVVDGRIGVSGAQPAEVVVAAVRQAAGERAAAATGDPS